MLRGHLGGGGAVVNTAGSLWGSVETFLSTFVNHLEH